ncbi:MAG TPA: C1 family peptidase [Casimicrobiaceae bacterium]|nr:C1 family peptidase [Casimicrobiaceae bacterium]
MPRKPRSRAPIAARERRLTVRPDTVDFRDLMYTPTLVEVPTHRRLSDYRKAQAPILDQGQEGACTGFGLATVVHYLMRVRKTVPDEHRISPYMLYDMARRYDEWAGERYEGSSCRGAMKGWHKHGVCELGLWPRSGGQPLSETQANDAARRPLGAYFRVNHRDLVAMHAAITEVGALYVSSNVHSGWDQVGRDGVIRQVDDNVGGHAFALVAYDENGFWLQNSWGADWGRSGFAHIAYEDWLSNGTDAWVARLAVPVELPTRRSSQRAVFAGAVRAQAYSYTDLRPHVISIGDHGLLDPAGNVGTTPELVQEIVRSDIPRITNGWKKKRIVLYAHGGLVNEDSALQRVSDYRQPMLDAQCYPLAFIWHSDAWSTIKDILQGAADHRRPEGFIDGAKDFMLDRLDDALEPLARTLGGLAMWSEMKDNALAATASAQGGARLVLDELAKLAATDSAYEFHLVGHSAGSIFHAPIVQYLAAKGRIAGGPMQGQNGLGLGVASATLWAPAITVELFKDAWLPALAGVSRFAVFTLDDQTEQDDDCASIYHKSLLYLVSDAFEKTFRVPLVHPDGEPILGMQKAIKGDPVLSRLFGPNGSADWVIAPNREGEGSPSASRAKHHGDFDDDKTTVLATLARVLGRRSASVPVEFEASAQRKRAMRRKIDQMRDFALTR